MSFFERSPVTVTVKLANEAWTFPASSCRFSRAETTDRRFSDLRRKESPDMRGPDVETDSSLTRFGSHCKKFLGRQHEKRPDDSFPECPVIWQHGPAATRQA